MESTPSKGTLERAVLETTREVGDWLRGKVFSDMYCEWKSTDDPVTILDREAEKMARDILNRRMNATIIGEEYGVVKGNSEAEVYIDPVDGTKSLIRREFLSSLSIAASLHGELVVGCVYDFMRGILYKATGIGSEVYDANRKRWHGLPFLDAPVFSKPTIIATELDAELESKLNGVKLRQQSGSIALSAAQVASGSYDGFIIPVKNIPEKKKAVAACDMAAGYYMMKQAGIDVVHYDLSPYDFREYGKGMIAVSDKVKDKVYEAIKR